VTVVATYPGLKSALVVLQSIVKECVGKYGEGEMFRVEHF